MLEMYRRALLKRGISATSLDSEEDSQVAKPMSKRRPPLISELPFLPKWASGSNDEDDAGQPAPNLVAQQRDARRTAEKVPWHQDN